MVSFGDVTIARFHPIAGDAVCHGRTGGGHSEFWMKGGRGSTKSSFISLLIVLLIVLFPYANAVVVRRYGNTLRGSVYNQVLWAVAALGLQGEFKATTSPMELTYLPTGQKIVFLGMDDPLKTKGVKFTTGYCAAQWFEELDQFDGWQAVGSALRSFRRGGDRFWTFYSYNPPRTMWSWVNAKALEMQAKPGCLVDHSTYLDVIEAGHADWLGAPFVEDAEYERWRDTNAYRWEFLGEVTGTEGNVFENLREVRLTDADIQAFDNRRNGVDWGWWPDPWRFVQCEWEPARRRLVVFGERSANKRTSADTAQVVRAALTYADAAGKEPRYHAETVWCDDAQPEDIAIYRRAGINARKAGKGGLRKASYLWLAGLREIAIDPVRCPQTWREFSLCEYAKDRSGAWIEDFDDGNDHSIDAVRYAMMREVRRSM